jgi:hypothetical protein
MDMSVEEKNMGNPNLQLKVEWQKAREAADHLTGMLADEVSYLTDGDKLKNVYSPIAWIRLCRAISTLTAGMAVMRLVFEGKTNEEIQQTTGLPRTIIAAYKAWNTMYSRGVKKVLAANGKTEEQRKRDLEFLASIGVKL